MTPERKAAAIALANAGGQNIVIHDKAYECELYVLVEASIVIYDQDINEYLDKDNQK